MGQFKVLIADSTASLRQFIKYSLEDHYGNITIDAASNGKNIQRRVEGNDYDLIIYDRAMPLLSGDELLKWLRGHNVLKNMPVIIMSTDSQVESLKTMKELGATAYIIKPFKVDAIVNKVAEIFGIMDKKDSDRRKHIRRSAEGEVHMKFSEHEVRGSLVDISRGGVLGRFEAIPPYPHIMDDVMINIQLKNGYSKNGLEGNIIRINAVDTMSGEKSVLFGVRFKAELSDEMENELG